MPSPLMIVGAVAGLALLAAAGMGWLLKQSYEANGALETKLANAQEIIDQRERDAKENAKAVAQLAQKLNETETKVVTTERVIYAAPKTIVCRDQPSIRAAIDGVQQFYIAPALQAPGGRQPPTALSGPNAPAK